MPDPTPKLTATTEYKPHRFDGISCMECGKLEDDMDIHDPGCPNPTPKLTEEGIAKVINGLERPESMDMLRLPEGVNECDFGILTPREQLMILQYAHRLEDRFKEALAKEQAT